MSRRVAKHSFLFAVFFYRNISKPLILLRRAGCHIDLSSAPKFLKSGGFPSWAKMPKLFSCRSKLTRFASIWCGQVELDLDLVGLEVLCLEVVVVWLCHLHPTGLEVVVVWLCHLDPTGLEVVVVWLCHLDSTGLEVVVVWLCHLDSTGLEVVVVWLRQLQPHTLVGHSSSPSRRPHHHILALLGVWRCKSHWKCRRCSKALRETVKVSFHSK